MNNINQPILNKIKSYVLAVLSLVIFFITVASIPNALADDAGIIFPESNSRLVNTDIEDESGVWGPDGPGGFLPGGMDNINPPPDVNGPGSGDPGSGNPGHSGDPNEFDETEQPGFLDRLRQFGRDLLDGAAEAGRDLWEAANNVFDYVTDPEGLRNDASSFGQSLWESITDTASSIGEWFSDQWNGLSDWAQDLIITVGIVVGVVAAIAVIVVVGLISIPVAIVAAAGAAIAGGIYFFLHGGTDSYNWMHALGWTAGGAIAGGLLQATGGLAAGAQALWKAASATGSWIARGAQTMWRNYVHLGLIMPLRQQGLRAVLGGLLKGAGNIFLLSGGIVFTLDVGTMIYEIFKYGESDITLISAFTNGLFAGTTAVLTFNLGRAYLIAGLRKRLGLIVASGGFFGGAELLRGYLQTGEWNFANFAVAALVGMLIPPAFGAVKEAVSFFAAQTARKLAGVTIAIEIIEVKLSQWLSKFLNGRLFKEPKTIQKHDGINREIEKKYY